MFEEDLPLGCLGWSGRSLEKGNGGLKMCLGNPMGRGTGELQSQGVTKSGMT